MLAKLFTNLNLLIRFDFASAQETHTVRCHANVHRVNNPDPSACIDVFASCPVYRQLAAAVNQPASATELTDTIDPRNYVGF